MSVSTKPKIYDGTPSMQTQSTGVPPSWENVMIKMEEKLERQQ